MTISQRRQGRQDNTSHVKQSTRSTAQILLFPVRLTGRGALWADAHVVRAEPAEYVPVKKQSAPQGDAPHKKSPAATPVPLKDAANEYLQRGWKLMRLPPRSKTPYKRQSFAQNIIGWGNIDTLAENNLAVLFTRAGELKDLDLDYQVAADLASELGFGKSAAAFGRPSVGIGHYLFNAAGCEAKAFNLPEPSPRNKYPRELPIHDGKPSPKVLELRGNDNTYSVFPPSIHPSGETIDWVGSRREPETITANKLHALAGRHAFAAAVLYFYPETASARYDVRMALTGALVKAGMPTDQVTDYVQAVARLAGDPTWDENFAERTEQRLKDQKETTGLTKLIEVLQLPDACLGTFYDWLSTDDEDAEAEDIYGEPYDFPAEETLPHWDFLYGTHLMRGEVAGTAASGGRGKSTWSIGEGLDMASGKELFHEEVPRPLRVLLINLEDSRATMSKRIAAAMRHHGLTKDDIGGRLFVKCKGELKFRANNSKSVAKLVKFIKDNQIDVVSIDPFIRTHDAAENDNVAMQKVVEAFEDIAFECNCAISLWHHTRKNKGDGSDGTVDASRGASAFVDACRSVRVLEPMSDKEAEKMRVVENRRGYFKSFSGKLNYSPTSDKCNWYCIINVTLDNGPQAPEGLNYGGPDGDNVGVTVAWHIPAPVKLSEDLIEAIKMKLCEGIWRDSVQAAQWAGNAIAPILGLNQDDDKEKIKQALKELLRDNYLKKVFRPDARREQRQVIVPFDWVDPDETPMPTNEENEAPVVRAKGGRGKKGGVSEVARESRVSRQTLRRQEKE
jgi:RecA-family ATPase